MTLNATATYQNPQEDSVILLGGQIDSFENYGI